MNKCTFIVVLVILVVYASIGSALRCYECSHLDRATAASCGDPFQDMAPNKTCGTGEVCAKQTTPEITIGNNVIPPVISRGCAPSSLCSEVPAELRSHCYTCTLDYCNSGITIIPSLITTVIALSCVTFAILQI